jgi:hypothetical protein
VLIVVAGVLAADSLSPRAEPDRLNFFEVALDRRNADRQEAVRLWRALTRDL